MALSPCIGNCAFSLSLPKHPASGEEIAIKAHLREDAKRFSINLCLEGNDPDAEPMFIAYHLGLHFSEDGGGCQVVQASRNVDWHVEDIKEDSVFNSRTVNIVLRICQESIKVFHEDTHHCPDFEFSHHLMQEKISSIQLRDDIDRVDEIVLKFVH